MQSRRKYSTEFKQEAVQLASAPGVSRAQVAGDLGINAGMLGRWTSVAGHPAARGWLDDADLARLLESVSPRDTAPC